MRIAVLALQGAFAEHEQMLQRLGVETFQIRQLADWEQPKDGLVIPGGESTVQAKLLSDLHLLEPIRKAISEGLPVFGTCAGLILLSKKIGGGASNSYIDNGYRGAPQCLRSPARQFLYRCADEGCRRRYSYDFHSRAVYQQGVRRRRSVS